MAATLGLVIAGGVVTIARACGCGPHPGGVMIPETVAGLLRLVTGAGARWIGCEPHSRPRIYFANHTSHLDGPTLWATLPPSLRRLHAACRARGTTGRSQRLRRWLAEQVFQFHPGGALPADAAVQSRWSRCSR